MSCQYLAHLILGKKITLDKGYEDKYNRLLRFVYIGITCVNEEMIALQKLITYPQLHRHKRREYTIR